MSSTFCNYPLKCYLTSVKNLFFLFFNIDMSSSKFAYACLIIFYWFSYKLSLTCLISNSTFSVRSNLRKPILISMYTFFCRIVNSFSQFLRPLLDLADIMALMLTEHQTRWTNHRVAIVAIALENSAVLLADANVNWFFAFVYCVHKLYNINNNLNHCLFYII